MVFMLGGLVGTIVGFFLVTGVDFVDMARGAGGEGMYWWVGRGKLGCRSMLEVFLVHFLTELWWYKRQAMFPEIFCELTVHFTGVAMFYCEGITSGVHGEFLVGKCVPGNSIGIGKKSVWFLVWLRGCQGGEVRHGNFWLKIYCGSCFGDNGIRGISYFRVITYRINGVFFIEKLATALTLKINKFGVLVADKRGGSWNSISWVSNFSKRKLGGGGLYGMILLWRISALLMKKLRYDVEITCRS